MKKAYLLCFLTCVILTSCGNEQKKEEKVVEEKSIIYFDAKRATYTVDDTFNDYVCNGGLYVYVQSSDETEKQLTKDQFTWNIVDSSQTVIDSSIPFDKEGEYYVSINYKKFSTGYSLKVNKASESKLLSLTATDYTSDYVKGDVFAFNGVINAYYTDGLTKKVTSRCSFSSIDTSSSGEKQLTVSYKEGRITKTIEMPIFVSDAPHEYRDNEIVSISPAKGQKFDSFDQRYSPYLNASSEEEMVAALQKYSLSNLDTKTVKLTWQSNGSDEYKVHVSTFEDFSGEKVYTVSKEENSLTLSNLIPGTKYFWKVNGTKEEDSSVVNYFTTNEGIVRFIEAGDVKNIRDFGGFSAEGSKKIKYGLLYRGNGLNGYAGLAALSEEGKKVFNDELGIKTEIDFRTQNVDDNNQTENYFDSEKPYIKATISQYTYVLDAESFNALKAEKGPEYVGNGSPNLASASSLKTIFETLANKDSYPIYTHCNVGADRTGTFALLLGGLLGVSYQDLMKNYELTSFYSASGLRYRSQIKDGVFDKDSIFMKSGEGNFVAMQVYYDALMKYHSAGGSFQDACTNFLKSFAGISDETISSVKENLLQ